jgi:hypothetical protein
LTAEQLEAARAERMRQNGHGAITIEDVRTWIEETGLCIFLPRSTQAGQAALTSPTATPTFVEAVAGQQTNEPTLELIASAEALLVRLEAEGVAVRLNLAGQPGDQPDYVVAGWVLPYIYALRGDRDWRRSPQLTGSRQVSQLAVQAAKQLDSANMTAIQIRDALGREVTEAAVLRALHELWKQLRIIPVVPEVGQPALWQPLRQRFQKAIAEGASTSQVTAISVLASIYLQAVIAASMEDVEMFLSPLTSRSKIREVVRGLAATRQVHSTNMGHSPMFYVAGTLPEFPATPSFQINPASPAYRSSNYRGSAYLASYLGHSHDEESLDTHAETAFRATNKPTELSLNESRLDYSEIKEVDVEPVIAAPAARVNYREHPAASAARKPAPRPIPRPAATNGTAGKSAAPRPRPARNASTAHPRDLRDSRDRSRPTAHASETRNGTSGDRRRNPLTRTTPANGNGTRNAGTAKTSSRPASRTSRNGSFANSNGNHSNGAKPTQASHANGRPGSRPAAGSASRSTSGFKSSASPARGNSARGSFKGASPVRNDNARPSARPVTHQSARPVSRPLNAAEGKEREPAAASAAKRYSFSGQAKQVPKPAAKRSSGVTTKAGAGPASKARSGARPAPARTAASKRRG